MSYQNLFNTLWKDYARRNPQALKIYKLFQEQDEHVINDHIALRTFNDHRINVEQLASIFKKYGYEEKGEYHFHEKQLFAKHYEHPDPEAPKVFISELLLEKCSPELQTTVQQCINQIPVSLLKQEELIYSGVVWNPLTYSAYQQLLAESEYAAWMYAFGFCANHFTVNVNSLKKFKELQEVNEFLLRHKFKLNNAGGLIKGTPAEYLEQSSTLADKIEVQFKDGCYPIPSCYYEFAKRYPLPNGKLYSGFIASSADKIFESTDVKHA